MKIIYICGKREFGDLDELHLLTLREENAAVSLLRNQWGPYVPLKNYYGAHRYEIDKTAEIANRLFLERSDAIFLLEGWDKSREARDDKKRAESLGINIFYEADGIPEIH